MLRKFCSTCMFGLLLVLTFVSCSQDRAALQSADPRLVIAHSQGIISRFDSISVILSAVRDPGSLPTDAAPFVFDPPLAGRVSWSADGSRADFVPDAPLAAGTSYTVKFDFAALGEAHNGWFAFAVQAAQPNFSVANLVLAARPDGSLALSGVLHEEDIPATADVERLLKASLGSRDLALSWNHEGGGRHAFTLSDIPQTAEAGRLELSWDGRSVGSALRETRQFDLPALGEFKVLSVQAPQPGEPNALTVAFSRPLDSSQDLRGYIHTAALQDLRFDVQGGLVKVYAAQQWPESLDVQIERGIRSADAASLAVPVQASVSFDWQKPEVRFAPGGVIVPSTQGTTVVLETMNLAQVYVEALQVYGDNMLQFLQVNELGGSKELKRVGDVVWSSTIDLKWTDANKNSWMPYSLDLSPLLERYPQGMFQLRVNFGREHIRYVSRANIADLGKWEFPPVRISDPSDNEASYWDWYEEWFNWDDYYRYREEPMHPAFYIVRYGRDRSARRNVLVSDVGIIAKQDVEGAWHVAASDLRSVRPLNGARLSAYSYSLKQLGRATLDASGMAVLKLPENAEASFLVVESASNTHGTGYLKLNQSLAVSHFDISGEAAGDGLKGFIYGDRGVWRPGDDMHLVFVLYDRLNQLPANYPVSFELFNPLGQSVQTMTLTNPLNGFYYIKAGTDAAAPTGTWTARIQAGGSSFSKALKVETIMPNRLKMSLDYGSATSVAYDTSSMGLSAAWLHGAPAPDLRADVSMVLAEGGSFAGWPDYVFTDPLRVVPSSRTILYEGYLDNKGSSRFNVDLQPENRAPGPLTATFLSRVFERSGLFSSETFSLPYHPYDRYVGIKLPKGDEARNMLLTDTDHAVELVLVDRNGELYRGSQQVKVTLYKLQWRWWWEKGEETLAEQAGDLYRRQVSSQTVNLRNGTGIWNLNIKYPEWGRFLVYVEDQSGGHASGRVFYIDWPGWAGKSRAEGGDSSLMLSLSTNKEKYNVGEPVRITFPSNNQGKALVSIERAGRIIREEWIRTENENTVFEFPATAEMAPNVYVHVSFVQNHLQTANDLPIRLYGIVPVMVENPQSRLNPLVEAPAALAPSATSTFRVREAQGRPMTYTVAVVDEGLLGITRYRTPNPWDQFYKKEASLLKSFDLYKDVAGAFSGSLQTLLAIGGSEFGDAGGDRKTNRFPPVVRFFGPFSLAAGAVGSHELELGPYIGAVRFMVVAGTPQGAYGRSELEVPVRSDLMTFITAPRVLGPGEQLSIPVNVFSFLGAGAGVKVSLKVEGAAELQGAGIQQLSFVQDGDQAVDFALKVLSAEGSVRLTAVAEHSSGVRSSQTIDIPVRSAAVPVTTVASAILSGNRNGTIGLTLPGIPGSNQTWLELSTLPPIDLSARLSYLIGYPHGCAEQTTSRAFPQLFLKDATVLSDQQAADVQANVLAAIEKLQKMQTTRGGFVFWPGAYDEGQWLSNYITHFLVMASRQGYPVSSTVLDKALKYLNTQASSWNSRENYARAEQAYRLYVLAVAGKANIAAMNRYFEYGPHPSSAVYQMAAAYALAGNRERAAAILQDSSVIAQSYSGMERVYGSVLRDRAVTLEALNVLGDTARALPLFKQIAEDLSSSRSYSTHELSYALIACLPYIKNAAAGQADISWSLGRLSERLTVSRTLTRVPLDIQSGYQAVNFTNNSTIPVYARLVSTGTPLPGTEQTKNNGLQLSVRYLDSSDQPVNPDSVALGQDLIVEISVRNSYSLPLSDVALTFRAPAGWELSNPRLGSGSDNAGPAESAYDYRDLRDDRVMTYFPLARNEQRTFRVYANKTYNGEFWLPAIVAESMYLPEIQAIIPGSYLLRPSAQAPVRSNVPASSPNSR